MSSFLIKLTLYLGADQETKPVMINPILVTRFQPDRQVTKLIEHGDRKIGLPDHDGALICFAGEEECIRVRESFDELCELFERKMPA